MRGRVLVCSIFLKASFPVGSLAQERVTLEGRVLDESTGAGIPSVTVQLMGRGVRETSAAGAFRFEGVPAGTQALSIAAYGYASETRVLRITGDTTLNVRLTREPVQLEEVVAELIDIEGRVEDGELGFPLIDAEVYADRGRSSGTDSHGRFRLRVLLKGVPVRLSIRAFGYATADTIVVPQEDDRHLFELQPDPVVEALIAEQVQRIDDRPGFRYGTMDRERIVRYAGRHTLESMMQFEYARHLPELRLVIVDGRRWNMTDEPAWELAFLLPEEIQRIEIGGSRGSRVLIVYTRDFIRNMILRESGAVTCVYGDC